MKFLSKKRAKKKCLKRTKKGENNWKFGKKCTKFENALKQGW